MVSPGFGAHGDGSMPYVTKCNLLQLQSLGT